MTFLKKTTVYIANFQTQNKLLVCRKQDYPSEYMSIAKYSNECRNKKFFAERGLVFRNRIFCRKSLTNSLMGTFE